MFSPGEFAQYEKTIDRPRHDHMVCTKCGKIIEFANSSIVNMQRQLCERYEFESSYHTFQIFGICRDCRRSKRNGTTEKICNERGPTAN